MFNKTKPTPPNNKAAAPVTSEKLSTPSPTPTAPTSSARPSVSVIGGYTQVEGDINSDEDLTVEGRVSGIITCKQNTVTLGANSYINGDVFAHTLHVSGEVIGNLVALHRATIHKGAQVSGTIVSPCLVLEDGSVFHGSIDMDPDNDVLKSAFNDSSKNATQASTLNSASTATSRKAATEKPQNNTAEHDETSAKTDD
ncbi:polymer-forming cytoskeletal protein [Halovibrio sp. HP20-50]|uniref:bactofilin family protein n=1 Tax=Halovibrio sp. HP20-59 TaxID=3080275 RepID=UPI00294AC0A0|nr:polymer-forming cytoskeletal protein [Halovibrio sp. HP20-59]MEA2120234.1 polymer-forming cytoskeletal protein [Halovibrio sp. HP20-59]